MPAAAFSVPRNTLSHLCLLPPPCLRKLQMLKRKGPEVRCSNRYANRIQWKEESLFLMDVPRLGGILCIYITWLCSWITVCKSLWKDYVCAFASACLCICLFWIPWEAHTRKRCSEDWLPILFPSFFSIQPIFYQSGRPSPIRRAPLLHLCSFGPECVPCPLSHLVGSQWLDAWLLMIEPSLVNRCYHLCKPLPVPFAHGPLGRCERRTNV